MTPISQWFKTAALHFSFTLHSYHWPAGGPVPQYTHSGTLADGAVISGTLLIIVEERKNTPEGFK